MPAGDDAFSLASGSAVNLSSSMATWWFPRIFARITQQSCHLSEWYARTSVAQALAKPFLCPRLRLPRGPPPEPPAVVPLFLCGGAYCAAYELDKQPFRAVVDTGSPFMLVDGTCGTGDASKWGCYRGNGRDAGLTDTDEIYGGSDVGVEWRRGDFRFVQARVDEQQRFVAERTDAVSPRPLPLSLTGHRCDLAARAIRATATARHQHHHHHHHHQQEQQ